MANSEPKPFCHHVKANGDLCGAVPLQNEKFCYFHMLTRERLRRQRQAFQRRKALQFGVLEDQDSIQLALGDLANAVLAGAVDLRKGFLVLQTLQTASKIAKHWIFRQEGSHFIGFSPEQLNDGSKPIASKAALPLPDHEPPGA